MRIIQVKSSTSCIGLGKRGENLVRRIVFNLSDWEKEFGIGKAVLIHKRNKDIIPYIVNLQADGSFVYWDVLSSDVEMPGYGKCELSYYVNDVIVKTDIYRTVVETSMTGDVGEPPQGIFDWFGTANIIVSEAKTATDEAKEAAKLALDAAENVNGESILASDKDFAEMFEEVFGPRPNSEAS